MANDAYQCASSGRIFAGRVQFAHGALLDLIAAAPAGSWIPINNNNYSAVWAHPDFRPAYNQTGHLPRKFIESLSSIVWDDDALQFRLFGGGHASTSGEEIYSFDAITGLWALDFHSPDVEVFYLDDASPYGTVPVSGQLTSPRSCHTYDASVYLKNLKRYCWFGGAADPSGGPWVANGPDRVMGPFLLDITHAGKGWVSATTGSNVQRAGTTSDGVSLPGANAWSNRDWKLDHPNAAAFAGMGKVINGWAQYREEGGKDVVYVTSVNSGGTALNLFKITFNDLDYHNDEIEKIGTFWTGNSRSRQGGGLDTVRNIALFLGDTGGGGGTDGDILCDFWDLDNAGPSLHDQTVYQSALTGPAKAQYQAQCAGAHALDKSSFGIEWDETRGKFALWERGGVVYHLTPPADKSTTTGWYIESSGSDADPNRPLLYSEFEATTGDNGVCGKLRYSAKLDCYVTLQNATAGIVRLFKPADWTDPRTV